MKIGEPIRDAIDAGRVFSRLPRKRYQETFWAAALDVRNRPIGRPWIVSIGTADRCDVHPRDIFRDAVKRNARSVMIAHSHPSGSPVFSEDDKRLTRRVKAAAGMLGISLLDHILLAGEETVSYLAAHGDLGGRHV